MDLQKSNIANKKKQTYNLKLEPYSQQLYCTLGSISLAVNFNRARQSRLNQTVLNQSGSIGWRGVWKYIIKTC